MHNLATVYIIRKPMITVTIKSLLYSYQASCSGIGIGRQPSTGVPLPFCRRARLAPDGKCSPADRVLLVRSGRFRHAYIGLASPDPVGRHQQKYNLICSDQLSPYDSVITD